MASVIYLHKWSSTAGDILGHMKKDYPFENDNLA